MKIDLKSPAGIRLLTGGRFCTENIEVAPTLQSKTAAANGTVTPDEGYVGLGQVVVNVPTPEGYLQPTGTSYITANGEHDVTDYAKVSVAVPVPDGYVVPSGTKAITENGTHDVSGYANAQVNVPIPAGYIQPSGTKAVTENGTHDVSNYENVSVAVPVGVFPSGTLSITANGTYAVTNYASVSVNVPDSPLPIAVATEAAMTELLASGAVGGVYKYTGTTGTYENGALYVLEVSE